MLSVRRLEAKDLPERVAWFNAPSTYSQMSVDAPMSLGDTQQWFSRTLLDERRRDFVFELQDVPVVMGGLTDISTRDAHAELYVVVHPGRTGQGFGSMTVKWLCGFGFHRRGLNKIYLHTIDDNPRARALYERIGFRPEGVLRQHVFRDGAYVDRHVHSLLREEWRTGFGRSNDWKLELAR